MTIREISEWLERIPHFGGVQRLMVPSLEYDTIEEWHARRLGFIPCDEQGRMLFRGLPCVYRADLNSPEVWYV